MIFRQLAKYFSVSRRIFMPVIVRMMFNPIWQLTKSGDAKHIACRRGVKVQKGHRKGM